ncbi:TIGR02117 family protein [Salegentibacter sp. JZCK2]|uniref:TIGR02117 family protein n=1 Tax=Salegentibacter tibetensis TaxID=2873600 RepID=UPI001CCBCF29|nr:TIGR02117 family protein [Salegentibacter tibetensis]MBZ9729396.1 TIGR02117 family protein [Salegentibacter tibetensis]
MKQGLRYFLKFLLILIAPPVIYLVLALIGTVIPVNSNSETENADIEIYLLKQDMHTDILLPVKSEIIRWDSIFKPEHTLSQTPYPEFIGFGWGDLNFYRNTPQWEDLKLKVAFKALFLKSQSALHTRFFRKVPNSENLVKILVTEDQYRKLSRYILETVNVENTGQIQPVPDLNYYRDDAFYSAETSFHLFKTCNTWTNSALKASGLKACLWTPFPQGIFYQYR